MTRRLPPILAVLIALAILDPAVALTRREVAASKYKSASQLLTDLQAVPSQELGKRQYELVIDAFRAVRNADPTSGYCDDALMSIGSLYRKMQERFGSDIYRLKAMEAYRAAAREYPSSKRRDEALAMVARLGGGAVPNAYALRGAPARAVRDAKAVLALSDSSHPPGALVSPTGDFRPAGEMATIDGIRSHSYPDGTRVVLDLSGTAPLKYDVLRHPDRVFIDLLNTQLSAAMMKVENIERINDSLLRTVRLAQNRPSKARLVLDLKGSVAFDAFWLDSPSRLVLDVRAKGAPQLARTAEAIEGLSASLDPANVALAAPPRPAQTTVDGRHSLTRAFGLKPRLILIDAGHGDKDTGTKGPSGLQEQHVVLDVAMHLGTLLRERLGFEVAYTRTREDEFVELAERSKMGNAKGADLMISIHCNWAPKSSVRGIETYTKGLPSDPWDQSVAALENAASTSTIHELDDLIAKTTNTDYAHESREFASRVQARLHRGLSKYSSSIKNRGVRTAPFIVLLEARMPAILVEIGFLSNRQDERLMRKESFRREVAEYLYEGIADYANSLGTIPQRTGLSSGAGASK